jgi:mRNA interferase RelE/StbE
VPYTVTVLPAAHRGMKAVPADVQRRIIDGLDRLSENPRPPGARRLGGPGPYRTRVGDYRIVYERLRPRPGGAAPVTLGLSLQGRRRMIYIPPAWETIALSD